MNEEDDIVIELPASPEILILELLSKSDIPKNGLDTLQIAKAVYGDQGTPKQVNPTLYKLKKEGKIMQLKMPNKSRPHWKIIV